MNNQQKRVTVKLKHPNPLFEKWLIEWRDEAKEKESKMQHCYSKALASLKKYPLPLERGRDCKILNGFGDRLCQMLDEKLEAHNKENNSDPDKTILYQLEDVTVPKRKIETSPIKEAPSSPKRNRKEYIPTYRSGAYAILLVLYENKVLEGETASLTKSEIVEKGKHLCDKSFTKSDPGTYYTAWSSMKTLLDKEFVVKRGNPAKFSITASGVKCAETLYENGVKELSAENNVENIINERITQNAIGNICSSSNERTDVSIAKKAEENNVQADFETVIFAPNTFEILLIVDKHETNGSKEKLQNDPILSELTHLDVHFDVKHLKVGDYTWICRDRNTNVELVLPYIVERKRMDDFGSSIKDGRYHEQKFRLKQCGIQNIIYLIESYGNNNHTGLPISTLYQAATNTLIQDGFTVKFSESIRGTAQYLNCLTKILRGNYESKTVMSCPKGNLEKSTINDDLIPLMVFGEFNQSSSKYKNFTASEMFVKHLVQLKGLSIDKALAIVEKYPTPRLLKEACDIDIEETEKTVANIIFGKKTRIGPVISRSLCRFYTSNAFN